MPRRLCGRLRDYELVEPRPGDRRPGLQDRDDAVLLAELVAHDPHNLQILEFLFGTESYSVEDDSVQIVQRCANALRWGRLVLRPLPLPALAVEPLEPRPEPDEPSDPTDPTRPHLAWIEIVVTDESGRAIPELRLQVERPGGGAQTVDFGRETLWRAENLEQGLCRLGLAPSGPSSATVAPPKETR